MRETGRPWRLSAPVDLSDGEIYSSFRVVAVATPQHNSTGWRRLGSQSTMDRTIRTVQNGAHLFLFSDEKVQRRVCELAKRLPPTATERPTQLNEEVRVVDVAEEE